MVHHARMGRHDRVVTLASYFQVEPSGLAPAFQAHMMAAERLQQKMVAAK